MNTNIAHLAYLGDAVFELFAREQVLRESEASLSVLNKRIKKYVSAEKQAAMYHKIWDRLTADEQAVMKRGRNLHPATRAKNASLTEYRHATGLEALFGYLHQKNGKQRLQEIFTLCIERAD